MQLKVSDFLSMNRMKTLYEINKAEESKLTVTLVLNTDTGEFYWQANALADSIPPSDCIVHRCNNFPTTRSVSYLDEVIARVEASGTTLETGIIYRNKQKSEIIAVYEEMVNEPIRLVRRASNPVYTALRFEPTVHQAEIDARYNTAVRYISGIRPEDEYADVSREFIGTVNLVEAEEKAMKIKDAYDDSDYCCCGNCGYELAPAEWEMYHLNVDYDYCQKCGQKLKWPVYERNV